MTQQATPAEALLETYRLNDALTLNNRIVMAPMTRCMAGPGYVPTEDMAAYYARRAETGLIITEATIVDEQGRGYPDTPGIYSEAQVAGWRRVADAVHTDGGKIFLQLWHVGRVSHPTYLDGRKPVAPSAVKLEGRVPRAKDLEYDTPRALGEDEISGVVEQFARCAANALAAGCDGVEIHGANGYLIDQFLHYHTNHRTDEYGGDPIRMTRFALDVVDAVVAAVGDAQRVGIRLSPGAYFNMGGDPRDADVFKHVLRELQPRGLAYVHVGIFDDSMTFESLGGVSATAFLREHFDGVLIGCGSYTPQAGAAAIRDGRFDLLAIGRPLIANPDYVAKLRTGEELTAYDAEMLKTLH